MPMRTINARIATSLTLALSAALLLGGCGSDTSDVETAADPSASDTPTPTAEPTIDSRRTNARPPRTPL